MTMKARLLQVAHEQRERFNSHKALIQRDIMPLAVKYLNSDQRVMVVTGMRRVGKSTLVQQLMPHEGNYCYLNFEDEKLLDFKVENFGELQEALIEVYGSADYYFFDEIQNVDRFEIAVRKLQDSGKKVVLTGSNSSMLSMEFGTKLTGRYKQIELYPFSFQEYLRFKDISPEEKDFYLPDRKVNLVMHFSKWMEKGGLPEFLQHDDPDYVRTLFDNILYRDILVRYGIRRHKEFRELVQLLASNLTLPITFSSLQKSIGLSNSDTVKEYLGFLANAYMFYELRQYHDSLKKQLRNPRKIYINDPAFHNLVGYTNSQNLGRKLENSVYLELRRRNTDLYYFSGRAECDFVAIDIARNVSALQVCYHLTRENEKREIAGLAEALNAIGGEEGTILTFDQEDSRVINNLKIKVMPVWKWMIQE
jgi:predicted AAA+ superfamily ATPase